MSDRTGIKAECPSCGSDLELLKSKTGRVLFLCKKCGLQAFQRGEGCKTWFGKLVKNMEARK